MTIRLILRLDEHWPATPVAAWVLLGPDGNRQAEGESDSRHWPAADECDVLLVGAQCIWLEALLPRAARRDAPRLLAYALEDRLLSDPDSLHLCISHRRPGVGGETVGVLVIARERMRNLLAQLQAIGRQPAHFYSELQSAPAEDEVWHVAQSADVAIIRTGPTSAYAVDGNLLGSVFAQQLTAASSENRMPRQVVVHSELGVEVPDLLEETKIIPGAPYLWWHGLYGGALTNLLHGEFAVARRRSPLLQNLRRPVQLVALVLSVWLLANLSEVIWLRYQLAGLQERQARTFLSIFPNVPAIAPAAQMRQQLNLERARRGLLRDDDALALLAVLGESLGGAVTDNFAAISFADGRLDLSWRTFPADSLAPLKAQLGVRGLIAETSDKAGVQHLVVRPEVSP